jgi:uncharacterized protein
MPPGPARGGTDPLASLRATPNWIAPAHRPPAHPAALTMNHPPAPASRESLIDYPCRFPIKVMGAKVEGFVEAVTEVALRFDPGFDPASVELRDSRAGNYLGITITVTATSREQLDGLYIALSSHPLVKVVL